MLRKYASFAVFAGAHPWWSRWTLVSLALHSAALLALANAFAAPAMAAPKAVAIGPEVVLSSPRDGYVGRLDVAPLHGPVGTQVTVTGDKLPANQEFQLVW